MYDNNLSFKSLIKQSIFILALCLAVNSVYAQGKFAKWQTPSYFRGYNVLYESPKTLQDFVDFKNYGGNLFHIQPDGFFAVDAPYDIVQENIDGTDMLVDFCRQAGIHYVIGVRSGPGAYDTYDESQGTVPESRIWNTGNTAEQEKYAEMLKMIIERYSPDTLFVGINLVIEPRPKVKVIPANTSQLYKFFLENVHNIHMDQVYQFWVSEIRKIDTELPVIIESFGYSTPELFPGYTVNDPFIVYSFHNYQPNEFTKAETPFLATYPGTYWNITFLSQQLYNRDFIDNTILGKMKDFQLSTGAPVFLGEFGMILPQTGGEDYINDVLSICIENGWHFALWDWRRGSGQTWNIEGFQDEGNNHWKTVLAKFNAPPVPRLVYPINGENGGVNPVFVWDSLTSFTKYDLEIDDPLSGDVLFFEDIASARFTYTGTQFSESVTYTWRVRAKNPGGAEQNNSEWSENQSFYIAAPDMAGNEKGKNYLKQNSPNPFNPSTNIVYQLQKTSRVNILVYDIIGRLVRTLINTTQQSGSHTVSFNASNLPSGVYIYKLDVSPTDGSQSFTEIKRMVLVK